MNNLIISVGRQLGSGGSAIAQMLAREFGCKFYDKVLINMAAEESGFNPKIFEHHDENHGMLKSLFGAFSSRLGRLNGAFYDNSMSQESLFQIQSEVIRRVAHESRCVFVGRCADYILRDEERLFSVFITANDADRTRTISERLGCDTMTASKYIAKKEDERASYYGYYTSKKWGSSQSYDLCINSSLLGIDRTAEVIAQIIRERFALTDDEKALTK